jgi:hypothetical protein
MDRDKPVADPSPARLVSGTTDPELQNAWNEEPADPERLTRAIAKSRKLHSKYMKQLTKLRPRLNQHTCARFAAKHDSLFDSNLFEFTFGDRVVLITAFFGCLHSRNATGTSARKVNNPSVKGFGGFPSISSIIARIRSRYARSSFAKINNASRCGILKHISSVWRLFLARLGMFGNRTQAAAPQWPPTRINGLPSGPCANTCI